jgi:hypothetical protein
VLKAGSIHLGVRVAADGSVCGVSTSNDGFGRPSLTSCLVEAMSPAFTNVTTGEGSGCVDVTVPMIYKGN